MQRKAGEIDLPFSSFQLLIALGIFKVINHLLNSDQEGFFEGITMAPEEWKSVEALNAVLEVLLLVCLAGFEFYIPGN